jgi:hypothetical protein
LKPFETHDILDFGGLILFKKTPLHTNLRDDPPTSNRKSVALVAQNDPVGIVRGLDQPLAADPKRIGTDWNG